MTTTWNEDFGAMPRRSGHRVLVAMRGMYGTTYTLWHTDPAGQCPSNAGYHAWMEFEPYKEDPALPLQRT